MMKVYIHEAFYGTVSALSVHQLAAQGEMLYLATRIEQGNSPFFKNLFKTNLIGFIRLVIFFLFIQRSIKTKTWLYNLTKQYSKV